jgi:NitT/TauT family transport system ATP-binding protein
MSELYSQESETKVKINMKGLTKEFVIKKDTITAFKDINLKIHEGEFWCFVGPSGCGKTTLLRILADLDYPSSGELKIAHEDEKKPLNSMVFQEHALFPWMTVWNNIAYGLKNRRLAKADIKQVVEEYIEKTGLQKFAKAYPYQLSGGMKQRVSIARAFANDPEILLMDEPFASLDEQNRLLLQQELLQIWESNRKTVVFITHSIDEAIFLSDHIMLMSAHPGVMKSIYSVNIQRPRIMSEIRKSKEFNELFLKIWSELKEEVIR